MSKHQNEFYGSEHTHRHTTASISCRADSTATLRESRETGPAHSSVQQRFHIAFHTGRVGRTEDTGGPHKAESVVGMRSGRLEVAADGRMQAATADNHGKRLPPPP